MNERIKELVDQAKKNVPAGLEPAEWLDVYHKKFAELLIRECIDIIARRKDEAIDNNWRVDEAMSTASLDIMEQFGVE